MEILKHIISSQSGDEHATLKLVDTFKPLLKKYAYKLDYEDAYNDLLVDFISILRRLCLSDIKQCHEAGLISYISTAVHSCYVKRLVVLTKRVSSITFADLGESTAHKIESIASPENQFDVVELDFIKNSLTEKELIAVMALYHYGYTPTEAARLLGISRKNFYKRKNSALSKLKNILET